MQWLVGGRTQRIPSASCRRESLGGGLEADTQGHVLRLQWSPGTEQGGPALDKRHRHPLHDQNSHISKVLGQDAKEILTVLDGTCATQFSKWLDMCLPGARNGITYIGRQDSTCFFPLAWIFSRNSKSYRQHRAESNRLVGNMLPRTPFSHNPRTRPTITTEAADPGRRETTASCLHQGSIVHT